MQSNMPSRSLFLSETPKSYSGLWRYISAVLNISSMLLALNMLGLGVWFRHVPNVQYQLSISTSVTTENLIRYSFSSLLAAVGVCAVAVAVLGLVGMVSFSKYIFGMYFLSLILMATAYLGLGSFAVYLNGKVDSELPVQLEKTFTEVFQRDLASNNLTHHPWSLTQKYVKCCGRASSEDYTSVANENDALKVPTSCCVMTKVCQSYTGTGACMAGEESSYLDLKACQSLGTEASRHTGGCQQKVKDFALGHINLALYFCIVLFIIEIIQYFLLRQLETTIDDDGNMSVMTTFSVDVVDPLSTRDHHHHQSDSNIPETSPTPPVSEVSVEV